jgi:hypothetical protein
MRDPIQVDGQTLLSGRHSLAVLAKLWFHAQAMMRSAVLVGLLGFEPRTKGFTFPKRFRPAWTISSPSVVRLPVGRGTL